MSYKKLQLSDGEWMDIIDGDRDGLPRCCANISTLRDDFISAARSGGTVLFSNQLEAHFGWCFPEHDVTDLMLKVMDQLGLKLGADDHEPQGIEP